MPTIKRTNARWSGESGTRVVVLLLSETRTWSTNLRAVSRSRAFLLTLAHVQCRHLRAKLSQESSSGWQDHKKA
jgi:IS4 transposase